MFSILLLALCGRIREWSANIIPCPCAAGPKKQGMLLGKSSFLSTSFFDRSNVNSKLKPLAVSRDSSQSSAGQASKIKEDKKLLSCEKQETPQYEDDDDDSEDEWCIPHTSGGYQKVRSGAD
ncbi:uncharacterized protein TNIN_363821 [Trichonephila inaurata madagascariensis]|uniref:Uncharacterized protein n=1 Tax=Trichonephila inaurata madagascariensis TaxID=2747483 RepID=A0A8X6KE23_9ARAC|nr:uncharacterized protein TNIN_363821 [Trichonephila inaurata madagascariensis]